MNKLKIPGLTLSIAIGLAACNNSGTSTTSSDSTRTDSMNAATTTTSTNNYSAMADTVERNSQSGYYLNAKTGKPIHVKVNRSTGRISDAESNTPVNRYVDKRTWWVYGGDKWDTVGSAKMQGENMMYQDQSGKWVDYDTRWKNEDMNSNMNNGSTMTDSSTTNNNSSMDNTSTSGSGNSKMTTDHGKVKVRDHGNKVKIKTKDKE